MQKCNIFECVAVGYNFGILGKLSDEENIKHIQSEEIYKIVDSEEDSGSGDGNSNVLNYSIGN